MGRLILVTGGSRSGKSGWAQAQAETHAGERVYIATCPHIPGDTDMAERIRRHQADRAGRGWRSIEEELQLADCLRTRAPQGTVLIDCLSLWLNNLMYRRGDDFHEEQARSAAEELAQAALARTGNTYLVSNEVGSGVIPDNRLARRFADCAGRINQTIAAHAQSVVLLVCGIPLMVKDE